jgi:hypothetical protein
MVCNKKRILTAALLACAGAAFAQSGDPVAVYVNGSRIGGEGLLLRGVGRTVLPMRDLFQSLGAHVEWDSSQRAVYAWKPGGEGIRLGLGEGHAQRLRMSANPGPGNWGSVIGTQPLDAPAMMRDRRIYVPLRFASESLGADVRFVASQPAVYVQTQRVAGNREETPLDVEELNRDRERERQAELQREQEAARLAEEKRQADLRAEQDQAAKEREALRLRQEALEKRLAQERRRRQQLERGGRDPVTGRRNGYAPNRDLVQTPAEIMEDLEFALSVPEGDDGEDTYRRGESLPMRLVVRNTGDRTLVVPFATGQRFDVVVMQEGAPVWRWSRDRSFTQAATTVRLRPGEAVEYPVTWDMRTSAGRTVAAGRYLIRASLTPRFRDPGLVVEKRITITR